MVVGQVNDRDMAQQQVANSKAAAEGSTGSGRVTGKPQHCKGSWGGVG